MGLEPATSVTEEIYSAPQYGIAQQIVLLDKASMLYFIHVKN